MEKLVRHGKSLKLHLQVNKMIQKIIVIIHEMPNYQVLKLNHDLTLYVLNLLVSMVKSKKIDISAVCAQILTDVFNLNTDEKENIDKQISFLISSGAVKKVSNISLLYDKLKTCTLFFRKQIRNRLKSFFNNSLQNLIIPFNVNSITQIIIYNLLLEMGFRLTIVSCIILFL